MRGSISSLLLVSTLLIGELHTYFHGTETVNWIWKAYRPMTTAWNVKFAGMQVVQVLIFLAILLYKPNKVNRTTVIAMFWLSILDTALYFYDYKTGNFGPVYFWFVAFWVLSYYWLNITDWLWKKLHRSP